MIGRRPRRAIISLLVVVDIGLLLLAGSRFFTRVDMSRNGVYTLSRTSRDMVANLPDQLSIEYWVSGVLSSRYPFPSHIEDLLGEYATWSGGKASFRVIDPAAAHASPESMGLAARQLQMVDRDQVNLTGVYSGIVLHYLNRAAALPFVSDLTTLEYDVSSRIRALERNRARTLGILMGDSRRDFSRDFRALAQELGSQFQLEEISPGADIPADVTVLFVLGNRDLTDADLFPIDQYIMRGGRALFAVDAVDISMKGQISAQLTQKTAVQQVLAQYGVRVMDGMVLDVVNQRIAFASSQDRAMQVSYPPWVAVSEKYVDSANPIMARFSGLDLYWPCPLELIQRDGVRAEILARSSPDSWTLQGQFPISPALAQTMAPAQGQERSSRALAIALSGTFRSAFAGTQHAGAAGRVQSAPFLSSSTSDARIIVVGNEEFATDMIQFTQAVYNMTFLSNCAVWLAQEDDLLMVKTRAQGSSRLDAIPDLGDRARAMRSSVVVNLVVVPLAVVAAGVIGRMIRRRKRSRAASPDSVPGGPEAS